MTSWVDAILHSFYAFYVDVKPHLVDEYLYELLGEFGIALITNLLAELCFELGDGLVSEVFPGLRS